MNGARSDSPGPDGIPVDEPSATRNGAVLAEQRLRLKRSNRRIALTLIAVAAAFFAGTIVSRMTGDPRIGLTILGAAIFVFLVVAIGRNLRG